MSEFRWVTDTFAVAPQISLADIERAKQAGFSVLIMNRPDGETPGQTKLNDIKTAAENAGLSFRMIPITAPPAPEDIRQTTDLLSEAAGKKILAFCRSGTRSITLWAYAVVSSGEHTVAETIELARDAGYDLSPHRKALERLLP